MTMPSCTTPEPCHKCGAILPAAATGGLCAACMLEFGLDTGGPEADPEPAARSSFGGYELLGEIAHGGMGVVYRARQRSLGRIVALKTILAGRLARPEDVARFRLEAEAAAHLKHPNIVAIHEVGECEGQHFFSMDYIEGRSLSTLLRDGPVPAAQAARYVEKIARAVHYAHEQGVLHRDLKPSNILLDARDEPHITDFGLAKRLTDSELAAQEVSQLTLSGQVLGTPSFMPPEQAAGQRGQVGPRSDVYSLGAILYHLLTGRPPFVGADVHTVLAQVLGSEVLTPRLLNPAAPRDLETIALKCLEKDPARRYASALALAEDLARHLNHEPIHALPPSAIYRARKFVRRHRVGVTVAACFAVVLVAATVVSAMFAINADRERLKTLAAAADTKAVVDFLKHEVLAAARPLGEPGGLGREATIRAALDAAEPGISNAFLLRPSVEVDIRETLGLTYHYLGDDALGIPQLERALEIRRADPNWREVDATSLMHSLGLMYRAVGDYSKALVTLERARRVEEGYSGPTNRTTLKIAGTLGFTYCSAGQASNGIALLEETIRRQETALGTDDLDTLDSKNALGLALESASRFSDALPLRLSVLNGYSAALGTTNRKTLIAMNNLGQLFKRLDQPAKARPQFEEALKGLEPLLGPDHPATLAVMDNLASVLLRLGDRARSLELREKVYRISSSKLGPDHVDTLTSANNLAMGYREADRPQEAAELLSNVVARARVKFSATHPNTIGWMHNLALAYEDAGQLTNAVEVLAEEIELLKRTESPSSSVMPRRMMYLARLRMKMEDFAKAAEVLADLVRRLGEPPPADIQTRAAALAMLGEAELHQSRYTHAEQSLRDGLKLVEGRHPELPVTVNSYSLLGGALIGQKRFTEAVLPLTKAAEALERMGYNDPSRRGQLLKQLMKDTITRLAQAYEGLGDPQRADEWRKKLP